MKTSEISIYDAIIIGGGFYGCVLGLFLKKSLNNVLIIEKESDLLQRASNNNQARIHNGYHYPRSFMTALRSHINYSKFIKDFKSAVVDNYMMTYAVAKQNSKTTNPQFIKFCKQIEIPITPASEKIKKLFNFRLIEDVYIVEENTFDVVTLRRLIREELTEQKIYIKFNEEVIRIQKKTDEINLELSSGKEVRGKIVINATYAGINTILRNSSLPLLQLKQEITEMPLVKMPSQLSSMGVTIIDGPFFSMMPFPSRKLHSIHHVRYTPIETFISDDEKMYSTFMDLLRSRQSKFLYMIKDAQRYIPALADVMYKDSLYEIKTVLTQTEHTDARPIMFRKDYGVKNFHVVLGGKIDNTYDIVEEMKNRIKL
jgi:glycine/D-amino acid oxidase-like deaminating enzyme